AGERPARVRCYPTRHELLAALRSEPIDNAFVLVKGSHGIGLEHAIEEL
ncbi:MAG TPA: UDP-N-acetylmuramyl peptide synthase, partial [Alistipes sp.]|nr:UDP-N-acetylmuramyl peptide synthase [Alistipes sp.]